MFIEKLHLTNFKRFTDLTIDLSASPIPYKLVLLIGANGSGKTSVFDAFEAISSYGKDKGIDYALNDYYKKNKENDFEIELNFSDGKTIIRNINEMGLITSNSSFYGRSSLRQVPILTRTGLGQNSVDFLKDSDRPKKYIERDERFENDLEQVTKNILQDFFKSEKEKKDITNSYINPINDALQRIFGESDATTFKLISIIPPLDGKVAEIMFRKGDSEIHYDLLSSGEKEIFNILINLLSRSGNYQNTIYFLDEIDLHLNTKLQYTLLKEITEHWIPENCQLWTASHSLGFIDYANDYEKAAIVDFDDLNFDIPQILFPQPKNKFNVFEIAVSQEFLTKLFEGKTIFFAENTDSPFYNNLKLDGIIFFTALDKRDVFYKSHNTNYKGIIDRDYLTDEEIELIRKIYPDLYILHYYSIENYLFHPDNMEEYYNTLKKDFDKESYKQQWLNEKNINLNKLLLVLQNARSGYPFFKENENAEKLKQFKKSEAILTYLESLDFETFFKVFPAKDYGKTIPERQNLNKEKLAQTQWFKTQIMKVLKLL